MRQQALDRLHWKRSDATRAATPWRRRSLRWDNPWTSAAGRVDWQPSSDVHVYLPASEPLLRAQQAPWLDGWAARQSMKQSNNRRSYQLRLARAINRRSLGKVTARRPYQEGRLPSQFNPSLQPTASLGAPVPSGGPANHALSAVKYLCAQSRRSDAPAPAHRPKDIP